MRRRAKTAMAMSALALTILASPAHAKATRCLPPNLKAALAHIAKTYGKVQVISAFRRGSIIAGSRNRSKHASCQAVDFHIKGGRKAAIQWLRRQKLEVITYSGGMHHVHIAVGSYKGHHVVDRRGRRVRR